MMTRLGSCCALLCLVTSFVWADASQRAAMGSFDGFEEPTSNWTLAGDLAGDPRHDRLLRPAPGLGLWVNRPGTTARGDLTSTWQHGNITVEFDYLAAATDDPVAAVVYLQGRYELQIANDRAAGLWQHARIVFAAPQLDAAGQVTQPARLVSLAINGVVTRSDETWDAPSASARLPGAAARGPLVIGGDHGSVALRRLSFRLEDATPVTLRDVRYAAYVGTYDTLDDYRHAKPTATGRTEVIDEKLANSSNAFAIVFTGEFVAPIEGWYSFHQETDWVGQMRVRLDGNALTALAPPKSEDTATQFMVHLAAGPHPFQLDYLKRREYGRPHLAWRVTGPGLAEQNLSVGARRPANAVPVVPIEPTADYIRTQRTFFPYTDPTKPYAGDKRIYVAAVGSPRGVHYAYDLEWQSLIAVWRGGFLDASGIWHERGTEQEVVPTGAVVPLVGRPALAALTNPDDAWPDPIADAYQAAGDDFDATDNRDGPPTALIGLPNPLVSNGYALAPDGQPTFKLTAYGVSATDRWVVDADGQGLTRTLTFDQPLTRDDFHLLLAADTSITESPTQGSYVIGDRGYYLDLPAESSLRPTLVAAGPHQQLRAPLPVGTTSVSYHLSW